MSTMWVRQMSFIVVAAGEFENCKSQNKRREPGADKTRKKHQTPPPKLIKAIKSGSSVSPVGITKAEMAMPKKTDYMGVVMGWIKYSSRADGGKHAEVTNKQSSIRVLSRLCQRVSE